MTLKIIEIGISYATSGSEMTLLDKLLNEGYRVVDCSTYTYDAEVTQRWTLHLPSPSVEDDTDTKVDTPATVHAQIRGILFNAGIPVVKDYHETPIGSRFTVDRETLSILDALPIQYDLVWRTDTSVHVEVLSIGDNTPAPFVCEMCGCECNGSVRNGHLYCAECLTELDEPYE